MSFPATINGRAHKKPGPKVRKVEFEFDWFIEYLNGKVEGAKKGGYLTVNKLKIALQVLEECGVIFFRKS